MADQKTIRRGQRKKRIPEVVQYALSHRIRIEVLNVLNQEGEYTAGQLAEAIDMPLNTVANHIRELLDAGSIEIAKTEPSGNLSKHFYRAVERVEYSQEEAEALTEEERQVTAGLVVQASMAEVLAALWKAKLADPRTVLHWDWYNVDQEGREALEAAEVEFLKRVAEIEVEATDRRNKSREPAQSIVLTVFGYDRARKAERLRTRLSRRAHKMVNDVHFSIDD